MDRDAAIGTDGAQLAQEIMENELVMGTDAYKLIQYKAIPFVPLSKKHSIFLPA